MDSKHGGLEQAGPAARLLGWLNFSDGRPDPKWQRQLDDTYAFALRRMPDEPWEFIRLWLAAELDALEKSENAAFRNSTQARSTLGLVFDHVLPAYRRHHADLLGHLGDRELFSAFFVARVAEAVLGQGGPWDDVERITRGALQKLNDYVGHRPIAVLENRPQTDLYPNEKVRPVPIFIKGAGVARGPYEEMIAQALDLLHRTDPDIRQDACFDPELLDELAYDPRPIDHGHPVNRRPNYLFGEWDPHHIDEQGRFRRFVVRKRTLDDVLSRIPPRDTTEAKRSERVFEAGAVIAGTILMAAGTSGSGPTMFDSTVTLSKLVPKIAHYRDAFYKRLIAGVEGEHGAKLRAEAVRMRQPFGAARQHVNQVLARQRAIELQESYLALLFAEMGYPEASRERTAKIEAVSVRLLAEMRLRLTAGHFAVERGEPGAAARSLEEVEDLLHRGINCGALADPWNAIGFQALFPLFSSREDSVRDTRLDDLVDAVSRMFHLYAAVLAAAAAAGEVELRQQVSRRLKRFAAWWDKHAVSEVSDLPRVHGEERATSAEHVADALAGVRSASNGASDLAYWRDHRDGFKSPSAFAQVVEALLRRGDPRASMALLMTWLSEAGAVPLEEGDDSFHVLATRWLGNVISGKGEVAERVSLVTRFFVLLQANADEFWSVPEWAFDGQAAEEADDVFEAAYEEVTYQDTADDADDGAVVGGGSLADDYPLDDEVKRLETRLDFLTTIAQLWQSAVPFLRAHSEGRADLLESLAGWQAEAHSWQPQLLELLECVHQLNVPEPVGGFEEVMEYDRRRMVREQLAEAIIETALETGRAVHLLASVTGVAPERLDGDPKWAALAIALEAELGRGDPAAVRRVLPRFLEGFGRQSLLFVPMSAGGHPRQILQSRQAQVMLRSLLERLPRLGLIRETYHLIRLAKAMEQNSRPAGRPISEFNHLFPFALQSTLDALLDAAHSWPPSDLRGDAELVELLRRITDSFLKLWLEHSQTLRLSVLETQPPGADWDELKEFIQTYGGDLFTPQFLALANLRSLIHRGVEQWLEGLASESEAPRLVNDVEEGELSQATAVAYVEFLCHALIEHHEEYRDYNSTTTQSDYGENLHLLLDFLKLKTNYDRHAWRMQPLVHAHAVLCRRGQDDAAIRWQASMASLTRGTAEELLAELARLEQQSGLSLRTVRDRLEERFLRPLVIDRLCASVELAMREAANPPPHEAFARLQKQLEPLTAQPIGIGLDVPEWLERLEDEVEATRQKRASSEPLPPRELTPGIRLSFAELQRQLADWEKAL